MNRFISRIEELKEKLHADRIIALWLLPDGTKVELPIDAGIASGAEFLHIVGGSCIDDAEKILDYVLPGDCVI